MIDDVIKKETEKISRGVRAHEDAKKAAAYSDYKTAYESLISAIMPIEAIDQYNWGVIYYNGHGVEKDYKKAFEWFKRASDKGYTNATRIVGRMYYNGEYVEKDYEKAFQYTMRAVEEGDNYAMTMLGSMYLYGEGVEKNSERAVQWFEQAAEKGNTQAMVSLGSMYLDGEGVDKNCERAVQWLEKAAEKGDKRSKAWLGQEYYRGTTLPRSYEKAWRWLMGFNANWIAKSLCDKEKDIFRQANCLLGMMYLHGKGTERDGESAEECLRYAAENGDEEAQFWLGFQYVRGLGVDIDIQEGDKWLKEAAKNSFEDAVKLQKATQKREILDAIWAKAKEEAEQDRREHAMAQNEK